MAQFLSTAKRAKHLQIGKASWLFWRYLCSSHLRYNLLVSFEAAQRKIIANDIASGIAQR